MISPAPSHPSTGVGENSYGGGTGPKAARVRSPAASSRVIALKSGTQHDPGPVQQNPLVLG